MTRTMKVRVLVQCFEDGSYEAYGFGYVRGESVGRAYAESRMGTTGGTYRWIEADVPVPETPTVRGEVVE